MKPRARPEDGRAGGRGGGLSAIGLDPRTAVPAAILAMGLLAAGHVGEQQEPALTMPLDEAIPAAMVGRQGQDVPISEEEATAGGATAYLYRSYTGAPAGAGFTVYVGYYASQAYGRTIHSPKNCLPGAGWEPLGSRRVAVATEAGTVQVNRYLIQKGEQRALALYWYQGRGRVEASEYRVKWDLLVDSGRSGRSEEALVRVLVPVTGSEEEADALAERVAATVIPRLESALPI